MSAIVSSIFEQSPASEGAAALEAVEEPSVARPDGLSDEELLRRYSEAGDQIAFRYAALLTLTPDGARLFSPRP